MHKKRFGRQVNKIDILYVACSKLKINAAQLMPHEAEQRLGEKLPEITMPEIEALLHGILEEKFKHLTKEEFIELYNEHLDRWIELRMKNSKPESASP